MTESEKRAWEAGIFEGEGTVSIGKPRPNNVGTVFASIANVDRSMLDHFLVEYGGSISSVRRTFLPNRRPVFRWIVASRKALRFLQAIQPYVRLARNVDRLFYGIACQLSKRHGNKTAADQDDYWAEQSWYYVQMKELNRRGCPDRESFRNRVGA